MSPRTTRRLLFTGAAAAPALALTVAAWATLGPRVTGLLALVVFCTAAAAYQLVALVGRDREAALAAAAREAAARDAGIQAGFDAGWHGGTGR